MADDEGIGDILRIVEVRNVGTPNVFRKTNIPKKKKKLSESPIASADVAEEEAANEEPTGIEEEKHNVDIKV